MATLNQASWLMDASAEFTVREAPYWKPGPGEVVIKNSAIAINPYDVAIQTLGFRIPFVKKYPVIIGEDVAGEICDLGEGVTSFKKGDRVIGNADWPLTGRSQEGGFQHYTVCKTEIVALLPDRIPFKSGAVLPLAVCTAASGLYPPARLGLPLPLPGQIKPTNKVLLIWGGSSSTGSAAIQLAVASGVTVITTASAKNHSFVKGIGATAMFDYNDEGVVRKLVDTIKAIRGEFMGALDSIAKEKTWRICVDVVDKLGGGKVVTNMVGVVRDGIPDGVELVPVTDTAAIVNNKELVEGIWKHFVPEALKTGTLKAVPEPIVIGKGLEHVPAGIELLKKGVSARKMVIEL